MVSSSQKESPPRREDGTGKRLRFGEEPIVGILREREAETKTADVSRRRGFLPGRLR
jgi:hypothetical protein